MKPSAALAATLGMLLAAPIARAAPAPFDDVWTADAWAAAPSGSSRKQAIERWSQRAGLTELLYVLRRPAAELGEVEPILADAAFKRAPASREALRRRLLARALIAGGKTRPSRDELPRLLAAPPRHPRASVFRVAAVLPDSGDYEDYARSIRVGIEAGLDAPRAPATPPIQLTVHATGENRTARAVAALDSAAAGVGLVIGELLSTPTLALAAAARMIDLPLVSPTASDESIGATGPTTFQIGPSGPDRGRALARATLGTQTKRVGILLSTALEPSSFARGFAAAAREMGCSVVWSRAYAAGSANFRDEVRAMTGERVEVLFWDGDPREAQSLLRQLARDKVAVRICGGEALAPEQHHAETRILLEGVQYVGDDWTLGARAHARLDSLVGAGGGGRATPLHVRGYLAGRVVRAAISRGALCPEELTAQLRAKASPDRELAALGFLDLGAEGALLEVRTIKRGRGVTAP